MPDIYDVIFSAVEMPGGTKWNSYMITLQMK
jgi:hypothetical protein